MSRAMRIIIVAICVFVIAGVIMLKQIPIKGSFAPSEDEVTMENNSMVMEKENTVIEKGRIYEITENNFQEGIYHDFTQEELAIWQKLLDALDYTETEGNNFDKIDWRYAISLYDAHGNRIANFVADEDLNIYGKDGNKIENTQVTDLLQRVVESNDIKKE